MSNDVPFLNLARVIRGGWAVIVVTILVFGLLGGIAGVLWPASYVATSTVQVRSDEVNGSMNMQTEQTIARSTDVLAVAEKELSGWSVASLRDAVSVTVPKDADVLVVSVSASSAKVAADAANAVAEAYLTDRRDSSENQRKRALTLLESQIKQFDEQITATTSPFRKQVLESRLAALNERYAAIKAEVDQPSRILSDAEPPDSPSTPALPVWVAVGLVAGAIAGFYIASVLYRIRRAQHE